MGPQDREGLKMTDLTDNAMYNLGFNHAMSGGYNPNMYRMYEFYRAGINRAIAFKKECEIADNGFILKPLPKGV